MNIRFALQINGYGPAIEGNIYWRKVVNFLFIPVLNFLHTYRLGLFQFYSALMIPTSIYCALVIAASIGAEAIQREPAYLVPSGLCFLVALMYMVFVFKPKLIVS